jgi:aldehyde dehydrogenase (NAD+)
MKSDNNGYYSLFIDGECVSASGEDSIEALNPATGDKIASIPRGTATDIDQAVRAATEAFPQWRDTAPAERGRTLQRIASSIWEREDELVEIVCRDVGKTLTEARYDVNGAARLFEYYAGAADKLEGTSVPQEGDSIDFTEREPYGVSAQIIPWNFPLPIAGRGIAPALAAGNTVVVKPAPTASIASVEFASIYQDAGVPDGVINVVTGGAEAGAALSSHDDVDTITFTGSVSTGQAVMETAAKTITPVTLELGGKNPAIVFPDADLEQAVSTIAAGITRNAGQACSAPDRAIVHESIYDEFVAQIVTEYESYTVGPGIEDPDIAAINHEEQFEKILNYIEVGEKEGATLETGGHALDRPGFFIQPTVFSDVDHDMRIAQEEIFGPVLCVIPFSDREGAIEIANDVQYGLTGGVFSRDINQALKTARDIEAATVYVNEWSGGGVGAPFGGIKKSGIGRESGLEGLDSYLYTKNYSVQL